MAFTRLSKDAARAELAELVASYAAQAAVVELPGSTYTEAQARIDYIDKFLRILGWDVTNDNALPQVACEVVVELDDSARVRNRPSRLSPSSQPTRLPSRRSQEAIGETDCVCLLGIAMSYLRIHAPDPAAVLTNFSQLIIYDATSEPAASDGPNVAAIPGLQFAYTDYVSRFDEIWERLSYETVASDAFTRYTIMSNRLEAIRHLT